MCIRDRVIVEPIMMNVGILMPDEGYHQALREITKKNGALLIFDEVKTGAKLARGGACEYFGIKPDIVCLAKSIGGGFSLAAFASTREVMSLISDHKVFHGGTYNTNPVAMAAGLAMFREVLTPAAYEHVNRLNKRLLDGYNKEISKTGLKAYVVGAGSNGSLMFFPKPVSYTHLDVYKRQQQDRLESLRRGRGIKWLANVFPETDSQLSRLAEG